MIQRGQTESLQFRLLGVECQKLLLTIAQAGRVAIEKTMDDVTVSQGVITVQLTQEETLRLRADQKALIQLRVSDSAGNIKNSRIMAIDVMESLSERVI